MSATRSAALLMAGALIGAGCLYAAQQGPSAVAGKALAIYAGLLGGEGGAHAEPSKPAAGSDKDHDHKDGDNHPHGSPDEANEKGGAHDHGKDDGHPEKDGHGHDDGHAHGKSAPKAEAGSGIKVAAVDPKDDGHEHGSGKEDEHGHGAELPEGVVELDDAKARAAGITLSKAGPARLREELQLNGVVQANQEATVQVTPRFPGVVKTLNKRLGDEVKKGEILAVVESNQSLTTYELRAPISGTITERQASLGEYVSEQKPAFVVTDLTTLWVDFSVYRRDIAKVSVGEAVRVDPEDGGAPVDAKISYVSPIGSSDTQSALARAVIPNDGRFKPGLFAIGFVSTAEYPAEVAVYADAIQSMDGKDVVFVRDGDRFASREIAIGRRDATMVEVTSGVKAGDAYAAKNSFVVKAELAKGEASHEH